MLTDALVCEVGRLIASAVDGLRASAGVGGGGERGAACDGVGVGAGVGGGDGEGDDGLDGVEDAVDVVDDVLGLVCVLFGGAGVAGRGGFAWDGRSTVAGGACAACGGVVAAACIASFPGSSFAFARCTSTCCTRTRGTFTRGADVGDGQEGGDGEGDLEEEEQGEGKAHDEYGKL